MKGLISTFLLKTAPQLDSRFFHKIILLVYVEMLY
jgi:hypothetical protein